MATKCDVLIHNRGAVQNKYENKLVKVKSSIFQHLVSKKMCTAFL